MRSARDLALRDYGRVVVRRRWPVLLAVLVAVVGSLLISLVRSPVYEAEAQMLIEPRSGDTVFQQDPALTVQNLDRAIKTEIQVLEGERVRSRVQEELGLRQLPPKVEGRAIDSTDVVSVTVRGPDAGQARALADAYVQAYTDTRREQGVDGLDAAGAELQAKVDELQVQIDAADGTPREALLAQQATFKERLDQLQIEAALTTGGASVVKSAELPDDPVEPQPLRDAALAGVIGLLVGLALAFVLEHLDDSIRDSDDLAGVTDQPVLAAVPSEPPPDERPIALSEPHEFAVETYRGLRTNIEFLDLDKRLRIIQITSSLPGEGKTTTAANLAVVLAQAGHTVVLVDADLRKPRLHEMFSVPAEPGFIDVLLGAPLDAVLHPQEHGLQVVTAGLPPANPSEMMSSPRVRVLLDELARRFEFVILDAPPVLPVSDSLGLAAHVDGILLVAQSDRVSRREVAEAATRLQRVSAPVFGTILNRVVASRRADTTYGYGYRYGYGSPGGRGSSAPTESTEPVS